MIQGRGRNEETKEGQKYGRKEGSSVYCRGGGGGQINDKYQNLKGASTKCNNT